MMLRIGIHFFYTEHEPISTCNQTNLLARESGLCTVFARLLFSAAWAGDIQISRSQVIITIDTFIRLKKRF